MTCRCNKCCHYKEISKIINNTEFNNIVDPATFIREKINTTFEITKEECDILERIKTTNDYNEYKNYLLKTTHHFKYICCTEFFYNKKHDIRCMYNNL